MALEYRFLFDGTSLDGWRIAGLDRFVLEKQDKSLRSEGGMGLLWYYKKKYRNFILNVDRKTQSKKDNSGIFVRFADPGDETDSGSIEIGLIIDSIRKLIFPKIMSQS